jgi:hypothetical protein
MRTLYNKTKDTPSVIYNEDNNKLELKGNMISFDSGSFWNDITREIVENSNLKSVDFDLEYINTDSIKELLIILKNQTNSDLEINWLYVDYDDDMKELGENLKKVSMKKINLIEK